MPTASHRVQRVHREVVSYVRRSARMNESQQRAWDAHASRWVIEVPQRELSTSIAADAAVDWAARFKRDAPLAVEIGSGAGENLAALALARPDLNIVAFEVFTPAVASTLARLAREGVDNVRIVTANGVEGLDLLFGQQQLTELWTFFPDPWHKARHHKRRLVSTAFADLVAARLASGALWRLATDWEDYALAMREVLDPHPAFENVHATTDEGWAPRWDARPVTRFEARGLTDGRTIRDLTFRRRP